jgi:hypothetical protein
VKRAAKPETQACADCAALRAQLLKARAACDDALLQLAREREKVNALRLAMPRVAESAPPAYPVSTGPGAPPLRYVLVDSANTALKRYFGPVQDGVKKVAKLAVRITGEKKR